jgi:hypothetical protein
MAMKFTKSYLAKEKAEYAKKRMKGKEMSAHEKKESKKKELAERIALRQMGVSE